MIEMIELPISVTSEQNLAEELFEQSRQIRAELGASELGIRLVWQTKGHGALDPSFVMGLVLSFPWG